MTTYQDDEMLIAWARKQTWSDFAQSVADHGTRKGLTERQRSALVSMKDKFEGRTPEPKTAPQTALSGFGEVVGMLDHIDASGNKWPAVRLSLKDDREDDTEDRRLKLFRYQHGQNMGSAGLKLEDQWLGNIDRRTGAWSPSPKAKNLDRDTKRRVWAVLQGLRDDPKTTFARNGKLLGTCACCGRPLSNDESVAIGIGPECREKLGVF